MNVLDNTLKTVQIPFDGFYESFMSSCLNDTIEREEENSQCGEVIGYTVDHEKAARYYVSLYLESVEEEYGLKLPLTFESLDSPKFYNFRTDEIYCNVEYKILRALHHRFVYVLDRKEAQGIIDARFKSRSGFASFYDAFCEEWHTKPLCEWDENELAILMPPVQDYYKLYSDCDSNGELTDCVTFEYE